MTCTDNGGPYEVTTFDGAVCKPCNTSTYPLSSCPTNGSCSECRDGANAGTYHYKLDSCTGNYKKSGNTCVLKSCSDYNSNYATSCISSFYTGCEDTGFSTYTTCEKVTPSLVGNLTCYKKSASKTCSCTTEDVTPFVYYNTSYSPNKNDCTNGYNDPDELGVDNKGTECNDGYDDTTDGVVCNACSTSTYPLSSCPANGTCSSCFDGSTHYKLDSCASGYHPSGNSCVVDTYYFYWSTGSCNQCTTINAYDGTSGTAKFGAGDSWDDYWWIVSLKNGSRQDFSWSISGNILSNLSKSTGYNMSGYSGLDEYELSYTINANTSTSARESTITLTQNGSGKKIYLKAYQNGKSCNWTGYVDSCPSNCNCTSKTDCGVTKYKIDSAKDDYKVDGNSCVLKGCTDYNAIYVTSCTASCSGTMKITCTTYTPRTGLTCYKSRVTPCGSGKACDSGACKASFSSEYECRESSECRYTVQGSGPTCSGSQCNPPTYSDGTTHPIPACCMATADEDRTWRDTCHNSGGYWFRDYTTPPVQCTGSIDKDIGIDIGIDKGAIAIGSPTICPTSDAECKAIDSSLPYFRGNSCCCPTASSSINLCNCCQITIQ